jgi:hypothetical protein
MADLIFVQGDTAPAISAVLHEADDADAPIDLTGCDVMFQMRKPDDRRYTVNAAAEIEDDEAGQVKYEWGPNDLSVPGEYQAQWEITFGDGRVQTTKTPITVEVRRQ